MFKIVRSRYEKRVLRLLEPVELREGEEVLIRAERIEDRNNHNGILLETRIRLSSSCLIDSCLWLKPSNIVRY